VSALPLTMIAALRGSLEGMSLTRVVFWINFAAFLINIPLDYIFVHGLWGLPRLGGVGCALASAILIWAVFFANLFVLKFHREIRNRKLLSNFQGYNKATILKTFKIGLPISLSIMIEISMFAGSGILIAQFGSIETGAHAVAITVASLSFMLYMGIGQGITIRASQLLGAEQPKQAWYAIKSGAIFNMILSVFVCIVFLLFTEPLIRLFSADESLIPLAVILLYFGAAFQIVDSAQVAAVFGLRAYQDTVSPPKYQFIAFWLLGLPLGIGLAFNGESLGLEGAKGMWMGMVVSLLFASVLLLRRLNVVAKQQIADSEV